MLDAIDSGDGRKGSGSWARPGVWRNEKTQSGDLADAAAARRRSNAYPFTAKGSPVDAALRELGSLIGLESVKQEVTRLAQQAFVFKDRRARGLKTMDITRHMVMLGNPGTGKNTVAELLGRIYAGYGMLSHGNTKYALRQDLVGEYVGHTATRTRDTFNAALGGVLFIDEAYSLVAGKGGQHDFGQEAINTLVPLMENHRNEIMVIAAGYPKPMRDFLAANPGLKGRFGQTIVFPDFTDDELLQIANDFFTAKDYKLTKAARPECRRVFGELRVLLKDDFANARTARLLCEATVKRQTARIHDEMSGRLRPMSNARMSEIRPEDIANSDELEPDRVAQVGAHAADDDAA